MSAFLGYFLGEGLWYEIAFLHARNKLGKLRTSCSGVLSAPVSLVIKSSV